MSNLSNNLQIFSNSLQKTDEWIKDLMQELNVESSKEAFIIFRCVLHAIRDRLPINEVLHFGAQLPLIIKGVLFEGWNPSSRPEGIKNKKEFLNYIVNETKNFPQPMRVEEVTQSVFSVLKKHVSEGEIQDILSNFPLEIRNFLEK